MKDDYLIKNTTREQREQIVKDSLGYVDLSCDEGGAGLGYDFYLPYIEGKMELRDLTAQFETTYMKDMEREDRGHCGFGSF